MSLTIRRVKDPENDLYVFEHIQSNGDVLDGDPNATSKGSLVNFKTRNGGLIAQNISVSDITVIDVETSTTNVYTDTTSFFIRLKQLGYFNQGSGTLIGGNNTLLGLNDTAISGLNTSDLIQYNGFNWVNVPVPNAFGVNSWNGFKGDVRVNTDDLPEGKSNLYFTNSRVDANANVESNTIHRDRTDNPHNVTKSQVGLSDADNTSDINKPISTAQEVRYLKIEGETAIIKNGNYATIANVSADPALQTLITDNPNKPIGVFNEDGRLFVYDHTGAAWKESGTVVDTIITATSTNPVTSSVIHSRLSNSSKIGALMGSSTYKASSIGATPIDTFLGTLTYDATYIGVFGSTEQIFIVKTSFLSAQLKTALSKPGRKFNLTSFRQNSPQDVYSELKLSCIINTTQLTFSNLDPTYTAFSITDFFTGGDESLNTHNLFFNLFDFEDTSGSLTASEGVNRVGDNFQLAGSTITTEAQIDIVGTIDEEEGLTFSLPNVALGLTGSFSLYPGSVGGTLRDNANLKLMAYQFVTDRISLNVRDGDISNGFVSDVNGIRLNSNNTNTGGTQDIVIKDTEITLPSSTTQQILAASGKQIVSKEYLETQIISRSVVLTDQAFTANTAFEIIPSPGAGKMIQVLSYAVSQNLTTGYSSNTTFRLRYGTLQFSTAEVELTEPTPFYRTAVSISITEGDDGTNEDNVINLPLTISPTLTATGGIGTVKFHLTYKIIEI